MREVGDQAGTQYGRYTVLSRDIERECTIPYRACYVVCRCECGTVKSVALTNLRKGHTTSCGCARDQALSERALHGQSRVEGKKTPEYVAWGGMLQRCYNPKNPKYKDYGGRGIVVCGEWRESFAAFYAYLGDKPGTEYSVDRIRVDGNYEPGNVRWATPIMQANNRRKRKRKNHGQSAP